MRPPALSLRFGHSHYCSAKNRRFRYHHYESCFWLRHPPPYHFSGLQARNLW